MNVIWIVSDTFRRDHVGAYGNQNIRTPSLDALAEGAVRFDAYYSAGFPTMPTRADHQTGRWTMSFMGWEPLPSGVTTLAEILAQRGLHTAASVETPPLLSQGRNELRPGLPVLLYEQRDWTDTLWSLIPQPGYHNESLDVRAACRNESEWISCVRPRRRNGCCCHGWNFGCRAVEVLTVSISVASWYRVSTDGGGWGRLPRGRPHLWQPLS